MCFTISCIHTQRRCNIRSLARATALVRSSGWSVCREVYSSRTCRSARALWRALRNRLLLGDESEDLAISSGEDEDPEVGDDADLEEESKNIFFKKLNLS